MKKISPARVAAFEILEKIEKEKAFSSVLLPLYEENLSPKDRALCHELTLGVLRRKMFLDKIIEKLSKKSVEKFDLEVILALRIGLYQLLFLDRIPAYSAINESVNLVHNARKRSASGLVNAVLRRASRGEKLEFEFADEIERISVETSHPRWLIENWSEQFGIEECEKIARANNQTPNSAFRLTAKFYRKSSEAQRAILDSFDRFELQKSELVDGCFIVEKFDDKLVDLVKSGDIYFQEEGSQLIGKVVSLQKDESFLDVCAAPGSKTTYISSVREEEKRRKGEEEKRREEKIELENKELFVAGDFYQHRIRNLRDNCENQGADFVQIVRYDAEFSMPFAERSFDVVLIDAPCSGTGTIRHNPEIRYFLQEKDFSELNSKQLKILQNASKLNKRGGRLIYSTCSLEISENENIIERFLSENTDFTKVLPNLKESFLTKKGFARTFPSRDQIDGFFISILEKK